MRVPDYSGRGLVNLVAELEHRLTGSGVAPRLDPAVAGEIPEADTYVVALIDGLGAGQLGHPAAAALSDAHRATIDAPWPTQTSVVTSTLATGLPPSRHGLIAYHLKLPGIGIVNTLYWYSVAAGTPVEHDPAAFLPSPNLAERLAAAGCEAVVVEPSAMVDSTIDRVLYRGAAVRGVSGEIETADTAAAEAAEPGRVVVAYFPHVDAAAHLGGQESEIYSGALATIGRAWERLAAAIPPGAALIGTADHGHVDVPIDRHVPVTADDVLVGGDARVLHLHGEMPAVAATVAGLPGTLVPRTEAGSLWGPGPLHPAFEERAPDALFFADEGRAFLFDGDDQPMIGHHGGLMDAEVEIPLLVHLPG